MITSKVKKFMVYLGPLRIAAIPKIMSSFLNEENKLVYEVNESILEALDFVERFGEASSVQSNRLKEHLQAGKKYFIPPPEAKIEEIL